MKIVCPSCEATYEVPEVVMTSRRKMRCARCGTDWVPADAADAAAAQSAAPAAVPPETVVAAIPVAAVAEAPARSVPAAPEPVAAFQEAAPHEAADSLFEQALGEPVHFGEPARFDERESFEEPACFEEPARDEQAQRVALRPETPVTVMPKAGPATVFSAGTKPLVVPPAAKGPPVLAWGASVAVLAAAIACFFIFRAPVMKAWPPSARLYAAMGLGDR